MKNLTQVGRKFELDEIQANSSQHKPSGWPNDNQLHRSCELGSSWCELGGPFGQGFTQGHTTRPCLPLPREPTVGFVHRRRPRHPQLLLYFSCHVSRQLWAAVEVQTNLWSNRNQCGTRQYGYSRYRDDDHNDGDDDDDDDDDGDDDRDNVDDDDDNDGDGDDEKSIYSLLCWQRILQFVL